MQTFSLLKCNLGVKVKGVVGIIKYLFGLTVVIFAGAIMLPAVSNGITK